MIHYITRWGHAVGFLGLYGSDLGIRVGKIKVSAIQEKKCVLFLWVILIQAQYLQLKFINPKSWKTLDNANTVETNTEEKDQDNTDMIQIIQNLFFFWIGNRLFIFIIKNKTKNILTIHAYLPLVLSHKSRLLRLNKPKLFLLRYMHWQ